MAPLALRKWFAFNEGRRHSVDHLVKEGGAMSWEIPERWKVVKYHVRIRDRADLPSTVGRNEIDLILEQRDEDPLPVFAHVKFIREGDAGGSGEDQKTASRHLWVHMRENSFAPMIDLLRNEKPIYWFWHSEFDPPWASLATDTDGEAVGEGEVERRPFFVFPRGL